MIKKLGSVRVDLLGGTLDLNPINLILPNVVTLNCATSLKAEVILRDLDRNGIQIISKDYEVTKFFSGEDLSSKEKLRGDDFGPFKFILQILDHFEIHSGITVELQSGSPAGAGLGGSSAMGVTLYSALCDWKKETLDPLQAITIVNSIEARILNSGPAGYQDYYPALYGGVLALVPSPGKVSIEQFYSNELKNVLEKRLTLVYSGETRLSGINNWEVYKKFFDQVPQTVEGLASIAKLSSRAFRALKEKNYQQLPELIKSEGAKRKELFPGIVSSAMEGLYNSLKGTIPDLGLKVCGAGGGGCFLLVHKDEQKKEVRDAIEKAGMKELEFSIEPPLI